MLADRGFNVHEAAGLYCSEVKLPPFTKGKKQLNKHEVDKHVNYLESVYM